jgi:hypothetical protein
MNVISKLRQLRTREHESTVEIIQQMITCYETRAHVEQGCSTLFSFLVEELKYSPAAASRRYKAMRVAMRFPQVLDMLAKHEVSLCSLAYAEGLLGEVSDPGELLDRIRGKSTRQVEKVVAEARPVPRKPRESVKPVAVKPPKDPLFEQPSGPVESRVSVRTTLTEADYEDFEKVRAIVSRKKPGATVEDTMVEMMQFFLKHKAPKERKQPQKGTKHIPQATRDAVMIRDGHRCTFTSAEGKRCTATHDLQIDHIKPRALGGGHEAENLRVLCGAHNRYEAQRILGSQVREPAPVWSSSAGTGRARTSNAAPGSSSNAGSQRSGSPSAGTGEVTSANGGAANAAPGPGSNAGSGGAVTKPTSNAGSESAADGRTRRAATSNAATSNAGTTRAANAGTAHPTPL